MFISLPSHLSGMDSTKESNWGVVRVKDEDFELEVVQSAIPVLVDFYADWCGPCKIIAPTMETLSNEYAGRVKFVKVNVDESQEVAMKYDILSIPTAIIFERGNVKDSIIGAYPVATYRQRLDRALNA